MGSALSKSWTSSHPDQPGWTIRYAVTAPNGRIYVFGGRNASGSTAYDTIHIYNPMTNTWSSGPTVPRARGSFAALRDCDGYTYLYGGNVGNTTHPEIDCFDTVSGARIASNPHTGGPRPNMLTPRSDVAGAPARNGRHYITGGNIACPVAVPTVEPFNPYNNTWSTEASLLESRNAHRALGLGSRAWIPGGYRKIWPQTQVFYIQISRGSGIGSSGYDLYISSSNDPQPIGQVYCHAATPNSIELQAASLPVDSFGYFLMAPEAGTIAHPGGSQGTL